MNCNRLSNRSELQEHKKHRRLATPLVFLVFLSSSLSLYEQPLVEPQFRHL